MLGSPDHGVPVLQTPEARRRSLWMPMLVAVLVAATALIITFTGRPNTQLVGSGSTLAQPLMERAATDFRNAASADNPERRRETGRDWVLDGTGIDYEPVGSLGGIMRLRSGAVDFAVSDYPLSVEALDADRLAQFPVAVGAVALVHNLDLPEGQQLRLDGETTAAIYLGEITTWDDPRIAAHNPGLTLPTSPIVPIHRTDGSGSTFGFTGWLTATSEAWASGPGANSVVTWPDAVGRGAERTSGALAALADAQGALGYVEAGQAARAGLEVVALRNLAGAFELPTPDAMAAAVAGADWSGTDRYTRALTLTSASDAYPVTVAVYALLKHEQTSRARQVLAYLTYVVDESDATAASLGYLPLPEDAARAVKASWQPTFGYTVSS